MNDKEAAMKARLIQAKYEYVGHKSTELSFTVHDVTIALREIESSQGSESSTVFPKDRIRLSEDDEEKTLDARLSPSAYSAHKRNCLPIPPRNLSRVNSAKKLPSPSLSNLSQSSSTNLSKLGEEPIDPRIEHEILRLNDAAATTNSLQVQLDEILQQNTRISLLLSEDLKRLEAKVRKSIEVAAPYYETKRIQKHAESQLQQATFSYARSRARLLFYKEQMSKLEGDLIGQGGTIQLGPLSLLNSLTMNVAECQRDVLRKKHEHSDSSRVQSELMEKLKKQEKVLKRAIKESRPYYKLMDHAAYVNEDNALRVVQLRNALSHAKGSYAAATANLQQISQEIHDQRYKSLQLVESIARVLDRPKDDKEQLAAESRSENVQP